MRVRVRDFFLARFVGVEMLTENEEF
jgi:hypothetical protein